jgi:hypothetical protein
LERCERIEPTIGSRVDQSSSLLHFEIDDDRRRFLLADGLIRRALVAIAGELARSSSSRRPVESFRRPEASDPATSS